MKPKKVAQLLQYLDQYEQFSIAVSGGIDSMLLAYIAHRFSSAKVNVIHAFSPAVPELAQQRVKDHAKQHNWNLQIINAREFNDENYINNPVNRCYFCKSNLYARIAEHSSGVIFSGTNLDDLGDFRPGLEAAKELEVKHPYVEVGIVKADIYDLAKYYDLTELYALPAQPCLASRVETGIKIKTDDMKFIDEVEQKVRLALPKLNNVRCRISRLGISMELDNLPEGKDFTQLYDHLSQHCADRGRVFSGIKLYHKGSAFLNGMIHG
jgi:uncharacterized protein